MWSCVPRHWPGDPQATPLRGRERLLLFSEASTHTDHRQGDIVSSQADRQNKDQMGSPQSPKIQRSLGTKELNKAFHLLAKEGLGESLTL